MGHINKVVPNPYTGNRIMNIALLCARLSFQCFKSFVCSLLPCQKKRITNDIILITGGGRGLGRQIALELAKHKPQHIVLWGRTEDALKSTCEDVLEKGVPCTFMVCDVSKSKQIQEKGDELLHTIGPVTILINNAGVVSGRKLVESSEEEMENTFSINLMGHFWTIKKFLPAMIDVQKGHIVAISSVLAYMYLPSLSDYCGSKAATAGLHAALASEMEEYPFISLSTINPYLIANEMFAKMRLRFPWIVPALSEDYVAKRTVTAILKEEKIVVIPRIMNTILILQNILPYSVLVPLYKFLGLDKSMENFGKRV